MVQMVYAMYACKWDSEKTFSFRLSTVIEIVLGNWSLKKNSFLKSEKE